MALVDWLWRHDRKVRAIGTAAAIFDVYYYLARPIMSNFAIQMQSIPDSQLKGMLLPATLGVTISALGLLGLYMLMFEGRNDSKGWNRED